MSRRAVVRGVAFALLLAMLAGLAVRSVAVVDATEFGVVTEFGRPIDVLGDTPDEAGPHWVAPWQSVSRIDRRLQVSEPAPRELMTADKKDIEVWPYFAWRVVDPVRFLRAAGELTGAEQRLEERLAAALASMVARAPLEILASAVDGEDRLGPQLRQIQETMGAAAAAELGVEVVDIGLRRISYPLEVRPAIFDLIRSERRQVAATLRSAGETEYQTRVSRAERDRTITLADADAEAARIEAEGDAEALTLLNAAHAEDPELYEFLRTLETYRSLLDGQATLVLSTSGPLFRLLREGPEGVVPPTSRASDTPSAAVGVGIPASGGRP